MFIYNCVSTQRAECVFDWIPNARNHLARAFG